MGIFSFFSEVSNSMKNTEIYGTPDVFLNSLIIELKNMAIKNMLLINNPGRLKIEYVFNRFDLTIDYIYMSDYLQVTIDVIKPKRGAETFKCNFDKNEVKELVITSISYINNNI
jgi:hypothetical protein